MQTKTCPICKIPKSTDEFNSYFSKARNKRRIQNYCKPCEKVEKKKRSVDYYQKNKEEKKAYAKDYRANNKDKIKKLSAHFTKKYRIELQDCYVAEFAAKSLKCSTQEIHDNPELLQAYRNNMLLKRKIRGYGTK